MEHHIRKVEAAAEDAVKGHVEGNPRREMPESIFIL